MDNFKPLPKGYSKEDIKEIFLIRPLKKEIASVDIKFQEAKKKVDKDPLEEKLSLLKAKLETLTQIPPIIQQENKEVEEVEQEGEDA